MDNKQPIKNFYQLEVWKESHTLALSIYKELSNFPNHELYGLSRQMRNCSVSVSSNIAEGFSRRTKADKAHFYTMSAGSLTELQSQVLIARDLHYMTLERSRSLFRQAITVHKLLNSLISKTKCKIKY